MRVCFLLTQDLDSPSGLGRYFPWAKELVHLGHEVNIIALHSDYANLAKHNSMVDGVKVEYVAQMHVRKQGSQKKYYSQFRLIWITFYATYQLLRAAMALPTDVLLVGKPHPMNGLAGVLVNLFRPTNRLIVDCDDYEAESNRFKGKLQKRIVAFFENWIPRQAHYVTANTYFMVGRLEALGIPSSKIIYVPNGIDEDRFNLKDQNEVPNLRNSLGLHGRKVIAYIGSMSLPSHPIDLLLKAFALAKENLPDTALMLVGGGEDLGNLMALAKELRIEEHIVFVGRVHPDDIAKYYGLSQTAVDPVYDNDSARGRCPLKMFESWACGVPFITSDVGDRGILTGDPPAAMLVEAGDEIALACGITKVLNNKHLTDSLIQVGRIRVQNYYWSAIAQHSAGIFSIDKKYSTLSSG